MRDQGGKRPICKNKNETSVMCPSRGKIEGRKTRGRQRGGRKVPERGIVRSTLLRGSHLPRFGARRKKQFGGGVNRDHKELRKGCVS